MSSLALSLNGMDSALESVSTAKSRANADEFEAIKGTRLQAQKKTQKKIKNWDNFFDKYEKINTNHIVINNPSVQKLSQLVDGLSAQLEQLKLLAQENPELTTDDLIQPVRSEIAKAVRELIWGVFDESGRAIGRNSPEAVKADARVAIKQGFESEKVPSFVTAKGRGNASNPKDYIDTVISAWLDIDQKIFKESLDTYNVLNDSSKLHPFYKSYQKFKRA